MVIPVALISVGTPTRIPVMKSAAVSLLSQAWTPDHLYRLIAFVGSALTASNQKLFFYCLSREAAVYDEDCVSSC